MCSEIFKTFQKFWILKCIIGVNFLEFWLKSQVLHVFDYLFTGFCAFWLNIHVFQEKSSGNTNQKLKLFRKIDEISKLFPNVYWERNGNIYPCPTVACRICKYSVYSLAPNEGRNNGCHLRLWDIDFETFRDFFILRDQKSGSASALLCTVVKGASEYIAYSIA